MAFYAVGGGLSTYVPSTNDLATGALQVEFTRTVNSFALTRYAQLVPTSKMSGYYLRQDVSDNVRITDANEFVWPLGNDRPTGKQNSFEFLPYTTQRFTFPFYIPQETSNQAAWDVVAQHARSKMQLAMTRRTQAAATTLADSNSWTSSGNYAAFCNSSPLSIGAGSQWTTSTTSNNYIQKTIRAVLQRVSQTSGGAVSPNQLIMVISPAVAVAIAGTEEVQSYVKNYGAALSFLQGSDTFARWGVPPTLFGLGDVVVDDSVVVTSKKGGTLATSWVLGNGAYFVSRPGGLVGVEGSTSFATLQIFAYEDMTVENWNDPYNRRMEGRVIDNSTPAVVAPVGGFAIGNVLAAS
jgi:hypothetical protein